MNIKRTAEFYQARKRNSKKVAHVKSESEQSLRPNKQKVKYIRQGEERRKIWFFINKLCKEYIKFSFYSD